MAFKEIRKLILPALIGISGLSFWQHGQHGNIAQQAERVNLTSTLADNRTDALASSHALNRQHHNDSFAAILPTVTSNASLVPSVDLTTNATNSTLLLAECLALLHTTGNRPIHHSHEFGSGKHYQAPKATGFLSKGFDTPPVIFSHTGYQYRVRPGSLAALVPALRMAALFLPAIYRIGLFGTAVALCGGLGMTYMTMRHPKIQRLSRSAYDFTIPLVKHFIDDQRALKDESQHLRNQLYARDHQLRSQETHIAITQCEAVVNEKRRLRKLVKIKDFAITAQTETTDRASRATEEIRVRDEMLKKLRQENDALKDKLKEEKQSTKSAVDKASAYYRKRLEEQEERHLRRIQPEVNAVEAEAIKYKIKFERAQKASSKAITDLAISEHYQQKLKEELSQKDVKLSQKDAELKASKDAERWERTHWQRKDERYFDENVELRTQLSLSRKEKGLLQERFHRQVFGLTREVEFLRNQVMELRGPQDKRHGHDPEVKDVAETIMPPESYSISDTPSNPVNDIMSDQRATDSLEQTTSHQSQEVQGVSVQKDVKEVSPQHTRALPQRNSRARQRRQTALPTSLRGHQASSQTVPQPHIQPSNNSELTKTPALDVDASTHAGSNVAHEELDGLIAALADLHIRTTPDDIQPTPPSQNLTETSNSTCMKGEETSESISSDSSLPTQDTTEASNGTAIEDRPSETDLFPPSLSIANVQGEVEIWANPPAIEQDIEMIGHYAQLPLIETDTSQSLTSGVGTVAVADDMTMGEVIAENEIWVRDGIPVADDTAMHDESQEQPSETEKSQVVLLDHISLAVPNDTIMVDNALTAIDTAVAQAQPEANNANVQKAIVANDDDDDLYTIMEDNAQMAIATAVADDLPETKTSNAQEVIVPPNDDDDLFSDDLYPEGEEVEEAQGLVVRDQTDEGNRESAKTNSSGSEDAGIDNDPTASEDVLPGLTMCKEEETEDLLPELKIYKEEENEKEAGDWSEHLINPSGQKEEERLKQELAIDFTRAQGRRIRIPKSRNTYNLLKGPLHPEEPNSSASNSGTHAVPTIPTNSLNTPSIAPPFDPARWLAQKSQATSSQPPVAPPFDLANIARIVSQASQTPSPPVSVTAPQAFMPPPSHHSTRLASLLAAFGGPSSPNNRGS